MQFVAKRVAVFALLSLAVVSGNAFAQAGDRAKTWDVGVGVTNLGSLTLDGDQGSGLKIDSEFGFGLWGIYNFTNRFGLGFDFNWTRPSYEARIIPENDPGNPITINTRLDIFSIQGRGVFHLLEGPITPYVEAGLGWTNVDSNVASGPPITGCWWDPWWGYICSNFFSTYGDTLTSWSGSVGLRWDFNNYYGMRAAYGRLQLNTSERTEDASFDMFRVEFAWRF